MRQTVVNSHAVRYICHSTSKFIATTATTTVAQLYYHEHVRAETNGSCITLEIYLFDFDDCYISKSKPKYYSVYSALTPVTDCQEGQQARIELVSLNHIFFRHQNFFLPKKWKNKREKGKPRFTYDYKYQLLHLNPHDELLLVHCAVHTGGRSV